MAAVSLLAGMAMTSVGFASTASATTETHTETWTGNGSDNLPCTGTLLWIFSGESTTTPVLTVDGKNYSAEQKGQGAYQIETPGTGVTTSSSAYVTYTGELDANAVLTISHCTGGDTPPPPTDVCNNIDGDQSSIPEGYHSDGEGGCLTDTPPPATDVCSNIAGDQATVPAGYTAGPSNTCVTDTPPVTPTDVCSNIAGNQATVPAGYQATNGVCAAVEGTDASTPTPTVVDDSGMVAGNDAIVEGTSAGRTPATVKGTSAVRSSAPVPNAVEAGLAGQQTDGRVLLGQALLGAGLLLFTASTWSGLGTRRRGVAQA